MDSIVLSIENVSKQYRLGQVGTGTISHDLNRFWAKIRGKEDPYLKVGDLNDRASAGESEYVWSLKDINFEVKQGEVLGIIGRNGAGKSTLLKILSQVTTPTTGQVKVKGRIAALLEVGTGFHPELTGRENIYLNGAILGMTKSEINSKFDEIVEFSGVAKYIDTPVKRYSSGMMVRLGFAVAAHLEPEILIVDEVLAVGDAEFQEKCLGKMKDVSGQGRTVLFVSHNMASVKSLCTTCLLLKNGMVANKGNTSQIISEYRAESDNSEYLGVNSNPKSTYRTEAGRIKEIRAIDESGRVTGEIPFEEKINIEVSYLLTSVINNINIDMRFISNEGIGVAHLSTLYLDKQINAKAGENKMQFEISNDFQPGVYQLEVGLHYPNNSTVDYVQQALTIRINPTNDKTGKAYFYRWPNVGSFRPKFNLVEK